MTGSDERGQLLAGMRVLEAGRFVAVPFAGRLLHLLGAEVIKLELPDDPAKELAASGTPSLYECLNEGKTVVSGEADAGTVDLAIADVRDVAAVGDDRELVATLRVVPGDTPLIADSALLSAMSAATWSIGEPGREPLSMPAHTATFLVGVVFAGAAVGHVLSGATGRHELDSMTALSGFVDQNATSYLLSGIGWRREGRRAAGCAGIYPYGVYDCSDGQVALIARSRRDWTRIAHSLGAESVSERFPDPFDIARHHADEADALLAPIIGRLTKQDVMSQAEAEGVLAVPVATIDDVLGYDNLADERRFWQRVGPLDFPTLPFVVEP